MVVQYRRSGAQLFIRDRVKMLHSHLNNNTGPPHTTTNTYTYPDSQTHHGFCSDTTTYILLTHSNPDIHTYPTNFTNTLKIYILTETYTFKLKYMQEFTYIHPSTHTHSRPRIH